MSQRDDLHNMKNSIQMQNIFTILINSMLHKTEKLGIQSMRKYHSLNEQSV